VSDDSVRVVRSAVDSSADVGSVFHFFSIGRRAFHTVYVHSPLCDTAVALAEFVLSE